MSMEILLGLAANAMTLATIGCFVYNLGYVVISKSISAQAVQIAEETTRSVANSLNIEGNEATAFFAFVYAFGMIAAAVRRNLVTACKI